MKQARWTFFGLILLLSLTTSATAAFTLKGVVTGPNGEALSQANILVRNAKGYFLKGRFVTDLNGNFSLQADEAVGALVFIDLKSGMVAQVMGPWNSNSTVSPTFAQKDFFSISGRIVDKDKILMEALMDPGIKWSGKFDHVARQVISINAYVAGKRILTVHPDEQGAYNLWTNFRIDALLLDSGGGGVTMTIYGPWKSKSEVDFVLTREGQASQGMYTISGEVRDAAGNPLPYQRVIAYDRSGAQIIDTHTRPDGTYRIKCNKAVQTIKTHVDGQTLERIGPWDSDATVPLAPLSNNSLTGRVVDEKGSAIAGVRVIAFGPDGKSTKAVASRKDGSFQITTEKSISKLMAYRDATNQNLTLTPPWPANGQVNIVISNKDVFTISGHVTDSSGRPVRTTVSAVDGRGIVIKSARSGKDGYYELLLIQEAASLNAYGKTTVVKNGPWKQNATVNFKVDQ